VTLQGRETGIAVLAKRDRNGYRYYMKEHIERLRGRRLLESGE